ncbi:hypothetical protein CSC17_3795 [Klebsiella oxytoca]|nr:hypothetical protein CSC17_3795 [Klebsiella oxytoca]
MYAIFFIYNQMVNLIFCFCLLVSFLYCLSLPEAKMGIASGDVYPLKGNLMAARHIRRYWSQLMY